MDKLKATILRLVNEKSEPNTPLLSPSQISSIEKKIFSAFPVFQTPSHPTYAVMIQSAIKALNEVEGSYEESISEYIKENYDGLPWAHDVYLNHHLGKLCENGEILFNSISKCYTIPARPVLRVHSSAKEQPCKNLKWKTKECMIDQEGNGKSSKENVVQGSENPIGFQGEDVRLGDMKIKRRRQRIVFEDGDDQIEGHENVDVVGVKEGNIISEGQELEVPRTNEDDLIEEWECVGKVVEDDVSSFKKSSSALNFSIDDRFFEPGLKESELMIVPYVENDAVSGGEFNETLEWRFPSIVCGLAEVPKKESVSKSSTKKKLKGCQLKRKISSEFLPGVSALAVGGNLLEHDEQPKILSLRQPETKIGEIDTGTVPPWLMPMLKGQYFIPCLVHVNVSRNERNMFCLDCLDEAFCHHCLLQHNENHHVVQIRKASYRNAVRVTEIEKYIDISQIQTYVINSAKIVFLNARAEPKPAKGFMKACEICLQSLIDHSRFCSLGCKFSGTLQESPKFQEFATDQSKHCSSEYRFIEPSERHTYLDPPHFSNIEEEEEEEEDLPLHKVLKKCAKRKKHVAKSQVDEKHWQQIAEITAFELETDDQGLLFTDAGPPGFVPTDLKNQFEDQARESCENDARIVDFEAPSSHKKFQQIQEGLCKPASSQSLKLKIKGSKIDGRRKPRKDKGLTKQMKRGPKGRPRKQIDASKGVSNSTVDHHLGIDGSEGVQKNIEAIEVVGPTSLNLYIDQQVRSSELTISQNSLLRKNGLGRPRKKFGLKKKGGGRSRKLVEPTKEDDASLSNTDFLQQFGSPLGQVTLPLSSSHYEKNKKDSQGPPLKQKGTAEGQETHFKALECEHYQQDTQELKKDGPEWASKEKERINNENQGALMSIQSQGIKNLIEDDQLRPRKQKELNMRNSSNQEKGSKSDYSSDVQPEQSEHEVHKQSLSFERANFDKGYNVEEKENTCYDGPVNEFMSLQSEVQGVLETQLERVTFGDDKQGNQLFQEQEELEICHETDINEGKSEAEIGAPKAKPAKITTLRVPLSSKDKLRSRLHRQSQDST